MSSIGLRESELKWLLSQLYSLRNFHNSLLSVWSSGHKTLEKDWVVFGKILTLIELSEYLRLFSNEKFDISQNLLQFYQFSDKIPFGVILQFAVAQYSGLHVNCVENPIQPVEGRFQNSSQELLSGLRILQVGDTPILIKSQRDLAVIAGH